MTTSQLIKILQDELLELNNKLIKKYTTNLIIRKKIIKYCNNINNI